MPLFATKSYMYNISFNFISLSDFMVKINSQAFLRKLMSNLVKMLFSVCDFVLN